MNKSEFLARLTERLPYDREEWDFIFDVLQDIVKDGLTDSGRVRTPLGTFKVKVRKSRRIVDISTKEERILPERKEIVFEANKDLKGALNGESEET